MPSLKPNVLSFDIRKKANLLQLVCLVVVLLSQKISNRLTFWQISLSSKNLTGSDRTESNKRHRGCSWSADDRASLKYSFLIDRWYGGYSYMLQSWSWNCIHSTYFSITFHYQLHGTIERKQSSNSRTYTYPKPDRAQNQKILVRICIYWGRRKTRWIIDTTRRRDRLGYSSRRGRGYDFSNA